MVALRMLPLLAAAGVLFLAASVGVSSAPGGELLDNGGFEDAVDGVPVAWTALSGTLRQVQEPAPAEGSYAGQLTCDATGSGQVRQAVEVGAGGVYSFSGLVWKNDPVVKWVELRIYWQDASGAELSRDLSRLTGDDPSFRSRSLGPVTAPEGAVRAHAIVLVQCAEAGGTIYLDDMSFEEVSPPPTATATPSPSSVPSAQATVTPPPSATPAPSATPPPTATGVPTPSHGLLVNGGFEAAVDGVPVGWLKYGGALSQVQSPVRSGSAAGSFVSETGSTKWIYQVVPVQAGAWYTLEGYVYLNDPGVLSSYLRVSWYATGDGSGSALSTTDSTLRLEGPAPAFRYLTTGPVQAPPGARSAAARAMLAPASAAHATIFLDDVSFASTGPATPTPIPSATAAPQASAAPEGAATGPLPPRSEVRGAASRLTPREEVSPFAVKINEVLPGPGVDAVHEWMELYNAGPEPVSLDGWTIADNLSADPLPALVLPPGGFAVIAGSNFEDGRLGNGLNDEGDRLILRDAAGLLVDAVSYGEDTGVFDPPAPAVGVGHSLERSPPGRDTDTAADFIDNAHPTPGYGLAAARGTPSATATRMSRVSSIAPVPRKASSGGRWWLWPLVGGLLLGGAGASAATLIRWRRARRGIAA